MRLMPPVVVMHQVTPRAVKGRAIQFRYLEDGSTYDIASLIVGTLGVKISHSHDIQGGGGYHVQLGWLDSRRLSDGDWVVVDSFGKVSVVPDSEFKTYYEPALTK